MPGLLVALGVTLAASVTDIRERRIPNELILIGLVTAAAVAATSWTAGWRRWPGVRAGCGDPHAAAAGGARCRWARRRQAGWCGRHGRRRDGRRGGRGSRSRSCNDYVRAAEVGNREARTVGTFRLPHFSSPAPPASLPSRPSLVLVKDLHERLILRSRSTSASSPVLVDHPCPGNVGTRVSHRQRGEPWVRASHAHLRARTGHWIKLE